MFLWPLLGYVDCRPLWGILPALCHIVRILHWHCAIIVRLSRLSMPTSRHQLPKYPLLLPGSVSDFSGVILLSTKKAFILSHLAAFRSVTWRGLLVGIRQDDMGTPPPPVRSRQGRGLHSKFAPYFQKKVTLSLSASSFIYVHHFSYSKPFVSWLCVRKKIPEKNFGDNFLGMFVG